jgi:hypothetical protein
VFIYARRLKKKIWEKIEKSAHPNDAKRGRLIDGRDGAPVMIVLTKDDIGDRVLLVAENDLVTGREIQMGMFG